MFLQWTVVLETEYSLTLSQEKKNKEMWCSLIDMCFPSCFSEHKEICAAESHLLQIETLRLIESSETIIVHVCDV